MIILLTPNTCSGEFDDILDSSRSKSLSDPMEYINLTYSHVKGSQVLDSNGSTPPTTSPRLLDVESLTLKTPKSNSTLVRDLSFAIDEKDNLLVSSIDCRFNILSLHIYYIYVYTELTGRAKDVCFLNR